MVALPVVHWEAGRHNSGEVRKRSGMRGKRYLDFDSGADYCVLHMHST